MAAPCSAALHRLNLDHCVSLTDPVVTSALQGLPALEFLSLNGCVGLREPLLVHKVLCEVLEILGRIEVVRLQVIDCGSALGAP